MKKKYRITQAGKRGPRSDADIEARIFRDEVITSESMDSHKSVIRQKGGEFARYVRNPVVLWAHNMAASIPVPIGRTLELRAGDTAEGVKAWRADYQYPPAGLSAFIDEIHDLDAAGFIRGSSIGFMPDMESIIPLDDDGKELKDVDLWDHLWEGGAVEIGRWELREWSRCPVPSNPDTVSDRAWPEPPPMTRAIEDGFGEWLRAAECMAELPPAVNTETLVSIMGSIEDQVAAMGRAEPLPPTIATVRHILKATRLETCDQCGKLAAYYEPERSFVKHGTCSRTRIPKSVTLGDGVSMHTFFKRLQREKAAFENILHAELDRDAKVRIESIVSESLRTPEADPAAGDKPTAAATDPPAASTEPAAGSVPAPDAGPMDQAVADAVKEAVPIACDLIKDVSNGNTADTEGA